MTEVFTHLRVRADSVAWILLILMLPVTSSPLLAGVAGASTVAPLAALPLAWLFLAWFLPSLARRGSLSPLARPILGFGIVALIASASAFYLDLPYYRGKTIFAEVIPALLTLALGLAFYLVIAGWARTGTRLRQTLRLINISGAIVLAWSFTQAFVVLFLDGEFPALMADFQDWISLRGIFAVRVSGFPRLTGFAYEPSWLAHQLNLVYLPYWLAASVGRFTAHQRRIGAITLENLLLTGGVVVLFLSFSRIGILAFLLAITLLASKFFQGRIRRWLDRWGNWARGPWRRILSAGLLALFLLVYLTVVLGMVYILSRFDQRLEILFDPQLFRTTSFLTLTNQLAFAERWLYWQTGWKVFNDHPFLGVGLGTAGFFFPQKMPAYGWGLLEITRTFFQHSFLPNIKSMWVRILAETGLAGFAFFATWLYVLWSAAQILQQTHDRLIKTVALTGQLALTAFLIEGFSIDSFALPYLWVATGILTAAASIFRTREALTA